MIGDGVGELNGEGLGDGTGDGIGDGIGNGVGELNGEGLGDGVGIGGNSILGMETEISSKTTPEASVIVTDETKSAGVMAALPVTITLKVNAYFPTGAPEARTAVTF